MAKWNTHQDMENRAYSHILTTLFPEQTKTVPRIILWSIVFLADLIGVCVLAVHWGIFDLMGMRTAPLLVGAAVIFLFWLEGFVFYRIWNLFRPKEKSWL